MRGRVPCLTALSLLMGCNAPPLELVVAPRMIPQQIAQDIGGLSPALDDLEIEVVVGGGALTNLDALVQGQADLAIVPNNVEFHSGVFTVTVLYTGVLHILHRRSDQPGDLRELVDGARVFAGPEGSMERWFLSVFTGRFGLSPEAFEFVERITEADVVLLFAPIVPEVPRELDGFHFYSLGDPKELGHGSAVEAVTIRQPQLRPFVIPARTYPQTNEGPVVTLGVDMLLVARDGLDDDDIYDLTEALVTHRRQLSEVTPALFGALGGEIDGAALTFPLHEGARQYFERDAPGALERYAELVSVLFSVFLASVSGLIALGRWRGRRRKDRIDVYYGRVLKIRASAKRMESAARAEALAEIRELEAQAFEALINEELAADEAFRIFVTLVNDTQRELASSPS